MGTLVNYYAFYNISKKIPDLSRALEAKDWIQAEKITEDEWMLWDPEVYLALFGVTTYRSLCPNCSEIKEQKSGEYCIECGTKLISNCPKCKRRISLRKKAHKYCSICGTKLDEVIEEEKIEK
jgi:hypothetical protein